MMSCAGNKTTNAASEGEETTVETVEAVVESDSCCRLKILVLLLATKSRLRRKERMLR